MSKKEQEITKGQNQTNQIFIKIQINKLKVLIFSIFVYIKHYLHFKSSKLPICLFPMEFNGRPANEYIPKFSQMYQSWYEINALISLQFQSDPYEQPCGEAGLVHTYWMD